MDEERSVTPFIIRLGRYYIERYRDIDIDIDIDQVIKEDKTEFIRPNNI
jgi:hypothetical protein